MPNQTCSIYQVSADPGLELVVQSIKLFLAGPERVSGADLRQRTRYTGLSSCGAPYTAFNSNCHDTIVFDLQVAH